LCFDVRHALSTLDVYYAFSAFNIHCVFGAFGVLNAYHAFGVVVLLVLIVLRNSWYCHVIGVLELLCSCVLGVHRARGAPMFLMLLQVQCPSCF
jgi:hypothetical protein